MGDRPLLEIEDLIGGYGDMQILHGLSLSVDFNKVTALLGANGMGKTTLMKTLAGLIPVVSGRIRFMDEDITLMTPSRRVQAGLVLVPEGRMVFPNLTVRDNLRLGAINPRALPFWPDTLEQVYQLFPRLRERQSQAAVTLSGGEQQMLAIGRGLMAKPKLMLLDEPTLGLAPIMAQQIFQLIADLIKTGLILLIAEQDVRRSLKVADYGFVVENGRLLTKGSTAELRDTPLIRQAYLGL